MDNIGCDMICKSHSARSDRDHYRICPTKLSKSELENLYFTLIENNLELKKTVNGQQDKIKMLSTKVQRMSSAQKIYKPDERKGCCAATKSVVNQQKEIIKDLKVENERMADRIRKLNMRLCSAKQFCKSVTASHLRCSTATSPYLIKHSPCTQRHQSQSTLKLAVSCQNLLRSTFSTKHTQTEALESIKQEKTGCADNKCSSFKEELKQKIVSLQEELFRIQEENSARTRLLQMELEQLRNKNIHVKSEKMAIEQELQQKEQKMAVLITNLRTAEGLSNELKAELTVERRKVAELETRLKAADMSNRVTKIIQDTLEIIQESNKTRNQDVNVCYSPNTVVDVQILSAEQYSKDISTDEIKLSKSTDDSGYLEVKSNEDKIDDQSLNKIIEELTKRIIVLQTQVDALTISPPTPEKVNGQSSTDKGNKEKKIKESLIAIPQIVEHIKNKSKNDFVDTLHPKHEEEQLNPEYVINGDEIRTNSPEIDVNDSQVPRTKSQKQKNVINLAVDTKKSKENGKLKENVDNIINGKTSKVSNGDKNKCNDDEYKQDIEEMVTEQSNNELNYKNIGKKYIVNTEKNINSENNRYIETERKSSTESNGRTYNLTKSEDNFNVDVPEIRVDGKEMKSSQQKILLNKNNSIINKPRVKERRKIIKQKKIVQPEQIAQIQPDIEPENTSIRDDTYTIEGNSSRLTSADNTDHEISSITDLSEEMEPVSPLQRLSSPGEHRPIVQSESFTTNTTDYSLSEGEILTASGRRKSFIDKPRIELGSKPNMEETLQAISEEIARCKRLMCNQRPQYNIMSELI